MKMNEIVQHGPEFSWEKQNGKWFVTDRNSYDGAEGSKTMQYGMGKTRSNALLDLYDQLLDDEVYSKAILDKAIKADNAPIK